MITDFTERGFPKVTCFFNVVNPMNLTDLTSDFRENSDVSTVYMSANQKSTF